jgi:hypothetical protein
MTDKRINLTRTLIVAGLTCLVSYYFSVQLEMSFNQAIIETEELSLRFNEITAKVKTEIIRYRLQGKIPKNLETEIDSLVLFSHNYSVRIKNVPSLTFGNPRLMYEKLDEIGFIYDSYYWDKLEWYKTIDKFRLLDDLEIGLLIPINRFLDDYRALDKQETYAFNKVEIAETNYLVFLAISVLAATVFFITLFMLVRNQLQLRAAGRKSEN